MHIYIPSLGRWGRPNTIEHLPERYKKQAAVVVHTSEARQYRKNGFKTIKTDSQGIANVRHWVMDRAKQKGQKYVLFLDDDMSFNVRKEGKLVKANSEEVGEMIDLLVSWLDEGFAHVGISARQGNHTVEEEYAEITRMNNAYAYNVQKYHEIGARFDKLQVMEDFYVTLQFLKAGLPNRVTYEYAWGQRKSGEEGGCSGYRTGEVQKQAAIQLSKAFPGVVKVKTKTSKNEWAGIGKVRTDVVIQWKKAYKPAIDKSKGIGSFLK